jgi:hypothetical protein
MSRFCSDFGSALTPEIGNHFTPTGPHGAPMVPGPTMRAIAPPPSLAAILAVPALPAGPLHGLSPLPQLSPYEDPTTRMSFAQARQYQAIQEDYSQQAARNAQAYDPSWQSEPMAMPDVPWNQGVDTGLDLAIAANDYDSDYYDYGY